MKKTGGKDVSHTHNEYDFLAVLYGNLFLCVVVNRLVVGCQPKGQVGLTTCCRRRSQSRLRAAFSHIYPKTRGVQGHKYIIADLNISET